MESVLNLLLVVFEFFLVVLVLLLTLRRSKDNKAVNERS